MLESGLLTCLIALIVGIFVYWLMRRLKYNYPPGPRGLPIIENLLQVDQTKLHEQAFEWSKKYGPVITLKLGLVQMIFVNHIDAALEVLVKKSTDFAARMSLPSTDVFTKGGKDIALASYGPTWKLHRRIATKALRHYMQGDALEKRINDALETAFIEIDKVTGEFDPAEYINFIVVNILTGLCFGGKYTFDDKDVKFLLKKEDDFVEQVGVGTPEDFVPCLKYLYKSKQFKIVEEFTDDVIEKFLKKKYEAAKSSFDRDNIRHFCDNLLLAREEAIKEGEDDVNSLTEDHLILTLSDIFFAGIDTSRMTLTWAIKHMIAFPDIQEKVQEEIDRVVGKTRTPGITDRPNLSYTEAVLHESMRYTTVVPLGLMHMTSCDTKLMEYKIPKGTVVAINHWALHSDPDAWEDVGRFIPERYLDENGKLGPKPKNWLPFSAGKRVCLGEFVAKPELHLIFAQLMQRYKWKMVSGKCADLTPGGNCFSGLCKPYKVIVEKRV
ncbi:hypothetical protein ACF0H5_020530 [Mactra antiquata]